MVLKSLEVLDEALAYVNVLKAGPPYPEPPGGPPPGKEGKEWNPQTARWRNPSEVAGVTEAPTRSSDKPSHWPDWLDIGARVRIAHHISDENIGYEGTVIGVNNFGGLQVENEVGQVVNASPQGLVPMESPTTTSDEPEESRLLEGEYEGDHVWPQATLKSGDQVGRVHRLTSQTVLFESGGRYQKVAWEDLEPVGSEPTLTTPEGRNRLGFDALRAESQVHQSPSYVPMQYELAEWLTDNAFISHMILEGEPTETGKWLMANMRPMGEIRTLYRGLRVPPDRLMGLTVLEEGGTFDLTVPTSTSRSPLVAAGYAIGTLLELETGEDTRAISLADADVDQYLDLSTSDPHESETILDMGHRVHITSVDLDGDIPVVRGRLVVGLTATTELNKAGPPYKEPSQKPPGKEDKVWNPRTGRWRNPPEGERVDRDEAKHVVATRQRKRSPKGFSEVGFDTSLLTRYTDRAEDIEDIMQETPAYRNYRDHEIIQLYAGTSYEEINEKLREGEVLPDARELGLLMKPLVDPYTVYRGINMEWDAFLSIHEGSVEPGDVLPLTAFTSTSRNPATAWNWGVDNSIFMEIQTDSDTRGIALANEDTQLYEYETILDFGQCVVVEQVDFHGEADKPVLVCSIVDCPAD